MDHRSILLSFSTNGNDRPNLKAATENRAFRNRLR